MLYYQKFITKLITDGETRTLTTKLLVPKTSASTNSATSVVFFQSLANKSLKKF